MPRYDYGCEACGHREERFFRMADMPSTIPCECGSDCVRVIDRVPELYVANREYTFDQGNCVWNFGKEYGRSRQQQHDGYRRYFDEIRQRKRALRRSNKVSQGLEWVGGMPGEMADSIGLHEGDPEAVAKDPQAFLKKTGMWDGD